MADIIDIASGEVGTKESAGNRTKYGQYTGANGAAWCHSFVSWCSNKAGVGTDIVPKTASTDAGMNWFKKKNGLKQKGNIHHSVTIWCISKPGVLMLASWRR